MNRVDCHSDLKQIYSRYETAREAIGVLVRVASSEPKCLRGTGLAVANIRNVADEFHDLYFVRIFAHFESILSDYWLTIRKSKPRYTKQLISSIAARLGVSQGNLDAVHGVRDFRNYLVHGEQLKKPYSIKDACAVLNTFVSRLPLKW
jgi:hypothetical protein